MALAVSEFVAAVRKSLIDFEGRVTRSEIYLTNVETSEEVHLCFTPEKIKVQSDVNFRTYNIVERGEISLPKGEKLDRISWSSILPGAQIMLYNFVTRSAWENPHEIIKVFKRWRTDGAKIKLLVTQTPLNLEVYLKSFDYEASGGMGDYKYSIDFIAAKDLKFETVEEADARREREKQEAQNALNERTRNKSPVPAWLDKVDDIWSAIKILTGKGTLKDIERVLAAAGYSFILDSPFDENGEFTPVILN